MSLSPSSSPFGAKNAETTLVRTLNARSYSDPTLFEQERREIFAKEWIYAADESDFKKPGDYYSTEIAGYPIFLILGNDLKVRAFHNYCLHRAAPLVTEPKGCAHSALTCSYHGWTYGNNGALLAAPQFELEPLKKACGAQLNPIQVGILNGLYFVNLDPKARPFEEALGPIKAEISRSGFDMNHYTSQTTMKNGGQFNWKIWVDGFQECYHCPTTHPVFNRDFHLSSYRVENKDGYSVHSCDRKVHSVSGEFQGLWLWVYPNLGMPCYEPCFYTLQINPTSVTSTELNYRFRFRDTLSLAARTEFLDLIEKITAEDVSVCEKVQKNISAGIYQDGVLHPTRENGVEYFHNLVRKALTN